MESPAVENPKVEVSNWTSRLRSDSPICDFDFWIFHCRTFHFPIPISYPESAMLMPPEGRGKDLWVFLLPPGEGGPKDRMRDLQALVP